MKSLILRIFVCWWHGHDSRIVRLNSGAATTMMVCNRCGEVDEILGRNYG